MRKNGYNTGREERSSGSRKNAAPMWTGAMFGILIGVAIAAGLAWYMMKSPKPFLNKEQMPVNPAPVTPAPESKAPANNTTSTATENNGKPRFEFYKVLTDKEAEKAAMNKHVEKPKAAEAKPAEAKSPANKAASGFEPQILQAGSFPNQDDAEKLKARLAMLGVEARVQSANIPDKGIWYRVRLGPYKTAEELSHARSFLKQNGVESTPMHAQ